MMPLKILPIASASAPGFLFCCGFRLALFCRVFFGFLTVFTLGFRFVVVTRGLVLAAGRAAGGLALAVGTAMTGRGATWGVCALAAPLQARLRRSYVDPGGQTHRPSALICMVAGQVFGAAIGPGAGARG